MIWRLGPDPTDPETGGGADRSPMTDEELDAALREKDRILGELDAEADRLIAGSGLDRDRFPAECRSCGWEGGAV